MKLQKFVNRGSFARIVALLVFIATMAAVSVHATGTVDTDIQGMIDNATSTWLAGKTLILSIAGFVVGLGIFWLAYNKARSKR